MKTKSLIPYGRQIIDEDDIKAVVRIMRSPFLTQGPTVKMFEEKIAKNCGVAYAVAFSSGTAALHGACFAAGITHGDEVITSSMTFAASANCVMYCGGKPIFADIKPDIPLIDPVSIKGQITQRTKAIIPVDYSGIPADYKEINSIAQKHELIIIVDAAHSLGAIYHNQRVGTLAHMTVFSFHPVKLITTGEGGIVVTNERKFYERLRLFCTHGITRDSHILQQKNVGPWYYEMHELGYNYRLTEVQAALGLSQSQKMTRFIKLRSRIAKKYMLEIKNIPFVKTLDIPPDRTSAWHLFPVRVAFGTLKKTRNDMFAYFADRNIKLQVHYIPVHLHPYYKKQFGYKKGDFRNAESFYEEEVSLPLFPELAEEEITHVINTLKAFLKS